MTGPYDDIINLPHPTSPKHPRMSILDRATQFSPFRALTGYNDAIHEAARLTDRRTELDENAVALLDENLQLLAAVIDEHPKAAITYFLPDDKKSGGEYVTVTARVKQIDEFNRTVVMMTGQKFDGGK